MSSVINAALGLPSYRFSVEATAYFGDAGRTAFRFDTEYDVLLTNRLILQPRVELNVYGKDDRTRGIGSGISSAEAGLRLRYEIRREIAPYAGVAWTGRLEPGQILRVRQGVRRTSCRPLSVFGFGSSRKLLNYKCRE